MRLTNEVEIPDELIHSLLDNRVVIFAGAGVSMASPTCFPSYDGLVERILAVSGSPLERGAKEPLDRFLGRLKHNGVLTHRVARRVLGEPSSVANNLHKDILRIFRHSENCRIVTTNFDQHFSKSAQVLFENELVSYYAPALPLGTDFHGLVYLHGSAIHEHSRLVLDDQDFGSAYLTEGWARRFIMDVFLHYIVLFVGYSHNDPIMQYLARGLPPGTQRYALTPTGSEEQWHFLGIRPVTYPLGASQDHAALAKCLEAWSEFMNNGYLETKVFIERIMRADSPPNDSSTADMLLWHMEDFGYLTLVLERATNSFWLTWFDENGVLDPIFDLSSNWDAGTTALANWIGSIVASTNSNKVLAFILRRGGEISKGFWSILIWHLSHMNHDIEIPPDTLSAWVHLLVSKNPSAEMRSQLAGLIESLRVRGSHETCISLFDYLTRPDVVLIPSFNPERDYSVEPSIFAETYQLQNAWRTVIRPLLDGYVDQIQLLISRNLEAVHMILCSIGQANGHFDPVSCTRRSIIPNQRPEMGHDFDILVDAGYDVIQYLTRNDETRSRALINQWAACSSPLLRRLSIHAVSLAGFWNDEEKLLFLCKRDFLGSLMLRRELFELLQACYQTATKRTRSRFLRTVTEIIQREDCGETEMHNICSILHLSSQLLPDDAATSRCYRKALKIYPDFDPTEYQNAFVDGHTHLITHGWGISHDELLQKSPEEVMRLVANDSLGFYSETIGKAVSQSFDATWSWVEKLVEFDEWNHPLWRALLFAWGRIELTNKQWGSILTAIESHEEIHMIADGVANLLIDGIGKGQNPIPADYLLDIDAIAFRILDKTRETSVCWSIDLNSSENSWHVFALSHATGKVISILAKRLGDLAQNPSEDWEIVKERFLSAFKAMLNGNTEADIAGRVIVAQEVGLLFSIDENWAKENVIPYFSWANTDQERTRQMWHGYLAAGQWTLALIPNLTPFYQQGFALLSRDASDIAKRQFFNHMAGLSLFWPGGGKPEWMERFLNEVGEDGRVEWSERITWFLRAMSTESKSALWQRWLRDYWNLRVQGLPLSVTKREAKAMLHWVFEFNDDRDIFLESIEFVKRCPSPGVNETRLMYEINSKHLICLAPNETLQLIGHALEGTPYPCYQCVDIITALREAVDSDATSDHVINHVKEQLIRLGCDIPSDL